MNDSIAWQSTSRPTEAVTAGRRRQGQIRVDDAKQRAQVGMRDAALDVVIGQVDDRDGRRLGARAAGGRDAEEREQRTGHGRPETDRRVEVVVHAARVRREQRRRSSPCRSRSRRRARRSRRNRPRGRPRPRASTERSLGSTPHSEKSSTSTPAVRIASSTGSGSPMAARCGSVSASARVTPAARRCQPVSTAAPGPNTSGVPATAKTRSCALTDSRPSRPCRASR